MSLTQSQAKYNGLMPTVASKNQSHQNGLKIIKIINGKKKKSSHAPQIKYSFESGRPGPLSHPWATHPTHTQFFTTSVQ